MTILLVLIVMMSAFTKSAPSVDNETGDLGITKASKPDVLNRVHRAGLLWLNVTNMGHYGNPKNFRDPCTRRTAVSGELPGGSDTDFLFAGALLFGGYKNLDAINGAIPFEGPYVTTAYAGWDGNPIMPNECWPTLFDADGGGSGDMKEMSNVEGKISCLFEEVYDPAANAEEQFNTMYTDKYVNSSYTGEDVFDLRDHIPLGIEVRQKSYAWSYEYAQKFIIIDYTLYNMSDEKQNLYDFFMGVYLDCDIGMPGDGTGFHADDLGGFIQKWEDPIPDPATGERKIHNLNLAWGADNDGRNYNGTDTSPSEPGAGAPLDGATGIVTVRVLRNPNPNLRYAFNMYVADSRSESIDWGPRWKPGLHGPDDAPIDGEIPLPWDYDLTAAQLGYDDYNQDNLTNDGGQELFGGRVEGRPAGDKGKYMVMSNDEFDYNQYDLIDVDRGNFDDPDYLDENNPADVQFMQANKWQPWITPDEVDAENPVTDGSIRDRNDLANGRDTKYILSFGPLGTEKTISFAYDSNKDGNVDSLDTPMDKTIWEFGYRDSLKLTLAFIVNDNFHTSLDQDPNYDDIDLEDTAGGIDKSLYEKGWYDALYNVVWAEKVYDIPMHDTSVKTLEYPEGAGDGWYGEDVGSDGIFATGVDVTECWWNDPVETYLAPDADKSEGNEELDDFITPFTDTYGNLATSEDDLLPKGREIAEEGVGTTAGGYGYMVKYIGPNAAYNDQWVRYGFGNNNIDIGDGVPDFTGPPPPPSPKIEVSYDGNDVIVKWASKEFSVNESGFETYSGPEEFKDPFTRIKDFEGYQVRLSPDLQQQNYVEIFSVDKKNYVYENLGETGDYLDRPFSIEERDSLHANGLDIISAEGTMYQIIPFGDNRPIANDTTSVSHFEQGVYEYSSTATTKDIIMESFAGTDSIATVDYFQYEFKLLDKLYARESYIAVTSTDFGDPATGTPALKSNPTVNGSSVIPTKLSNTEDVVVVPNPYRGDVDYFDLGWENIGGEEDEWQEQDRKIVFMNIPLRSVIRVYTLAGDLVKTIAHNGNARVDVRYQYGEYGAAWDLINENDQAVVSGIYLFSVQDADDDSYEQIGKFVIIK